MFGEAVVLCPSAPSRRRAAIISMAAHATVALVVSWIFTQPQPQETVRSAVDTALVWIPSTGAGAAGGGGGDRTRAAAHARSIGADRTSAPSDTPPNTVSVATEIPPAEPIAPSAVPMGAAIDTFAGVVDAAVPGETGGPGTGPGAGSHHGGGREDGDGRSVGDSRGDDGGDAIYGIGNGVTAPQLISQVRPAYTTEAMRARLQGIVLLECIVQSDGRVGEIRIVKSLDQNLGLDAQAVAAAKDWRFLPGRRHGKPVAVRVTIELAFHVR